MLMDNADNDQKPIVVSSADARGGLDPEEDNSGDTLLPMLIGGLVLIVVGVIAVWMMA